MGRMRLESDRVFEEWVARNNERIGEILIPELGEYPPTLENFYGSLMNEWVTTDLIRQYDVANNPSLVRGVSLLQAMSYFPSLSDTCIAHHSCFHYRRRGPRLENRQICLRLHRYLLNHSAPRTNVPRA
jgi:hypothetical protein